MASYDKKSKSGTKATGGRRSAAPPDTESEVQLEGAQKHTVKITLGGVEVARVRFGAQQGLGDEFDTGVYEIKDASVVVGLLWVRKNAGGSKTEFWGLSASYVWPSSVNTSKTFTFQFRADLAYNDPAVFKSDCNALFSGQTVTYLKSDPASF